MTMTESAFTSTSATLLDTAEARDSCFSVVNRVGAYWASLPKTGLAPDRMLVDARALSDVLAHVFLAELVTPRVARLRIVGHRIEELTGLDMRGMPLTTLFAGAARQEIMLACEQVSRGARVTLSLQGEEGFGRPQLEGMMALMPLCDSKGRISRVLGVIGQKGEVGRTPRRFGLAAPQALPEPEQHPTKTPFLRVINGGKA